MTWLGTLSWIVLGAVVYAAYKVYRKYPHKRKWTITGGVLSILVVLYSLGLVEERIQNPYRIDGYTNNLPTNMGLEKPAEEIANSFDGTMLSTMKTDGHNLIVSADGSKIVISPDYVDVNQNQSGQWQFDWYANASISQDDSASDPNFVDLIATLNNIAVSWETHNIQLMTSYASDLILTNDNNDHLELISDGPNVTWYMNGSQISLGPTISPEPLLQWLTD